jgi:hypothetical protein
MGFWSGAKMECRNLKARQAAVKFFKQLFNFLPSELHDSIIVKSIEGLHHRQNFCTTCRYKFIRTLQMPAILNSKKLNFVDEKSENPLA